MPVLQAIDRLLRIQERRARLLGLDMPVKLTAQVTPVDPADIELAKLIAAAQAANDAEEAVLRAESDGDESEGDG
jgi:hypothetical protein